jgi:hypothetical protein
MRPFRATRVQGSALKVDLDPQSNTTTSTIRLADNANKDVLGCCPNQPSIRSPRKQNYITRAKVLEMWMAPHILVGEIWLSGL